MKQDHKNSKYIELKLNKKCLLHSCFLEKKTRFFERYKNVDLVSFNKWGGKESMQMHRKIFFFRFLKKIF